MALPFGIKQETVFERGHDIGAPKKSYLLLKVLITTALATICWFVIDYIIRLHLIQFAD